MYSVYVMKLFDSQTVAFSGLLSYKNKVTVSGVAELIMLLCFLFVHSVTVHVQKKKP
jgi:hypothetical protein